MQTIKKNGKILLSFVLGGIVSAVPLSLILIFFEIYSYEAKIKSSKQENLLIAVSSIEKILNTYYEKSEKKELPEELAKLEASKLIEKAPQEAAPALMANLEALPQKAQENFRSQAAETVYEHEKLISKKIFEKGKVEGITETQLNHFAQSRINFCLRNLGFENLFKVEYNPVHQWFYKGINGYQMGDFFNSQNNQYSRTWDINGFTF
jgi:hypothetical protein